MHIDYKDDLFLKWILTKSKNGNSKYRGDTNPNYMVTLRKNKNGVGLDLKYAPLNFNPEVLPTYPDINLDEYRHRQVIAVCLLGEKPKADHSIRKDIRDALKNKPCVVCSTRRNIQIDHKNDDKSDPRVLDKRTQRPEDFQPLCQHCNTIKRGIHKKRKDTGKRVAGLPPSLKIFGIDFTQGDETWDPSSPTSLVGTYWYDPVQFVKDLKDRFNSN
jgi:hypothetical protein